MTNTTSSFHVNEFSRRANSYIKYNSIQKEVVKKLVQNIKTKPKNILDLGCGAGAVYNTIDWNIDRFVAIDQAENMCILHPKNEKIVLLNEDFENPKLLEDIGYFDIVISSSALQWAKDIESVIENISKISNHIAVSIFCDGTFKTIYNLTNMQSFLPNSTYIINLFEKKFKINYEKVVYKLDFKDNISKFKYIKQSGVSGGKKKLTFKQTKELIKNYPHTYLEFEVLFVWGNIQS